MAALRSDISDSSTKVGNIVSEVDSASREQSQGIGQINDAMTQIDSVTQQNAANAEEAASASEELSAQAVTMRAIVSRLNAMVMGGTEEGVSAPSTQHTPRPPARKTAATPPPPPADSSDLSNIDF